MLRPGDQIPHFEVIQHDGTRIAYAELWQRRNLLLVVLPAEVGADLYVRGLDASMSRLMAHETAVVITGGTVEQIEAPAVVIADRWGEVQFVASERAPVDLPGAEELIEWLRYVQTRCPECEGEAR
jgi:hypothetical protein